MRTLSGTLTAAQKTPAPRPHPKVEVYDKVAGITRHHWERYYTGAEDEKFHAVTVPGDGSLVRLRTDATNNLYWQRVTSPDSGSTYSSWTDWSVEAYAVSLCSYGAKVFAFRIGTDGHLYRSESADNGASWGAWTDMADVSGDATFTLASSFKNADRCLVLYGDGAGGDIRRSRRTDEVTEDLSAYTEVDPNGRITVTVPRSAFTNLTKNEDAYVYKDKGAAYFNGDFEIRFTAYLTSTDSGGCTIICSMANTVDDWDAIDAANDSEIGIFFYYAAPNHYFIYLREVDSGAAYSDNWETANIADLQPIYIKFKRVEADGTHGTIYAYLYSDSSFSTLIVTLQVALHTNKKDWRYLYVTQTRRSGDAHKQTGYTENFDLREGWGWEAPAAWSNSLGSVSGVAVVYQGDYNIMVSGVEGGGLAGVWTCLLGDGYSAAVGTWSSLEELMIAASGSNVTYAYPALALPDVYRAWFVEIFAGNEAYSRPYWTHGIASADFISNLWREPVPFNLASSYGLALTFKSPGVWLTRPDGVWYADLSAGNVELTDSVLAIKAIAREKTGELVVTLRNDDGRFDKIGDAADPYEHVKLGAELLFSPGYHTTGGGSPEHSTGLAYWIESFDYLSRGGRATLTIIAIDGWGILERWKARRQYSWVSGAKNIFQLLGFIHSRAGLEFSALGGSSAVVTDLEPAFTINPGESGKTACLRLLAMIPDVLFFRGKQAYLKYIQSSDGEDYTYGTDHAILEAHYHTRHFASNRIQVTNGTIFTEDFDWAEIDLVFDILEQDYDLALTTTTRTGRRAADMLRRATVGALDGYVLVPLNCGQEIYDVIKLTDLRAPLIAEKRRILGIDQMFYPAKAQYRTLAHLGAL